MFKIIQYSTKCTFNAKFRWKYWAKCCEIIRTFLRKSGTPPWRGCVECPRIPPPSPGFASRYQPSPAGWKKTIKNHHYLAVCVTVCIINTSYNKYVPKLALWSMSFFWCLKKVLNVESTETREGWPPLIFETEVDGGSKRTHERCPFLVGSSSLSCR